MAEHATHGRKRPALRFGVGLVVVITAFVGSQIFSFRVQESANQAGDSRIEIVRAVEQIRYYDELLTMSARLAAATGDSSFIDRYHQAVPKLDRVIADVLSLTRDPAATAAFHATEQANQELIVLEEKSFRQLAAGDRTGAYATVTGADYVRLKAEYSHGLDVALLRIERDGANQEARTERSQRLDLVTSVAGGALLLLLWAGTALALRRSERVRGLAEERLRSAALYDPLTGLANRMLLADRIRLSGRRRDRGVSALLYADLDDFKVINDRHGHAFGDQVLIEVSGRLQACARTADTVARLGGDEFAVFVEDLSNADQVADLARRFGASLSPPIELEGVVVSCGASIGSVTVAGSETFPTPDALLSRADLAMYAAKRFRKGSWAAFEQHMYDDVIGESRT